MKIKDQLLFEFCEQKKCVRRFKKICNHCLAYHFSVFIQNKEKEEPYCGAVDNILNGWC